MPFDDLRQWIAALEHAGELKRIQTEADPILEIAEITDRVSKSVDAKGARGGPAGIDPSAERHDHRGQGRGRLAVELYVIHAFPLTVRRL